MWHEAQHESVRRQPFLHIFRAKSRADALSRAMDFQKKYPASYAKHQAHLQVMIDYVFAGVGNRDISSSIAESVNAILATVRSQGPYHLLIKWLTWTRDQWSAEIDSLSKLPLTFFTSEVEDVIKGRKELARSLVVSRRTDEANQRSATGYIVRDSLSSGLYVVDVGESGRRATCSAGCMDRDDIFCEHLMAVTMFNPEVRLRGRLEHWRERAVLTAAIRPDLIWSVPVQAPVAIGNVALPDQVGSRPGRKKVARFHGKCETHRRRACAGTGHDASRVVDGGVLEEALIQFDA
jgi:hypothetical protein